MALDVGAGASPSCNCTSRMCHLPPALTLSALWLIVMWRVFISIAISSLTMSQLVRAICVPCICMSGANGRMATTNRPVIFAVVFKFLTLLYRISFAFGLMLPPLSLPDVYPKGSRDFPLITRACGYAPLSGRFRAPVLPFRDLRALFQNIWPVFPPRLFITSGIPRDCGI